MKTILLSFFLTIVLCVGQTKDTYPRINAGTGVHTAILPCTAAGANTTTYACSTVPSFTPSAGDVILFCPDVANTGASTLNVNSAGAKPLKQNQGQTALTLNDLRAAPACVTVQYDGTNWDMQGQGGNAGGGASGARIMGCPPTTVALTGVSNDIVACTITAVPALAAGQCYAWKGGGFSATAYTMKIIVDGTTTIASPVQQSPSFANNNFFFEEQYCNTAGVQNAQKLSPMTGSFVVGWQQGAGPTNIIEEAQGGTTYPLTPTAIDWSLTHTITVTIAGATANNGTLLSFKLW